MLGFPNITRSGTSAYDTVPVYFYLCRYYNCVAHQYKQVGRTCEASMLIAPRSFTFYLIFVFCVLVLVLLHHLSTFSYSVDVSLIALGVSREEPHRPIYPRGRDSFLSMVLEPNLLVNWNLEYIISKSGARCMHHSHYGCW